MNKARLNIATSKLVGNSGQLDWLPRNPRTWTLGDVNRTIKSITTDPDFLEDRPLLAVPAESGKGERYIVFAGNLRLKACKESNVKTAPVVVYFPESDEDRETVKRRAMLDNGSFGSWDYDALANEWDDLSLVDLGIPAWEPEQDAGQFGAGEEGIATEDDFDETQDEIHVLCAKGDVWQLGDHRLMCGDSTDLETVKKLMGGGEIKADMVFTDPPYNVAIGSKNAFLNAFGIHGGIQEDIIGDKGMTDEEIGRTLWRPAFKNAYECAQDYAPIYVTMPQGGTHMMMMMMIADSGWKVKHELIWVKSSPTFSMGRLNYDYQHEPIMYGWKDTHKWYGKGNYTKSIWEIDKPNKNGLHPTMKPVELVANALQNSSQDGDSVLDLFGGSGTTLIAAEQLGRKCYMMELDPHYCDVIIARWEKLTGKKATKIN